MSSKTKPNVNVTPSVEEATARIEAAACGEKQEEAPKSKLDIFEEYVYEEGGSILLPMEALLTIVAILENKDQHTLITHLNFTTSPTEDKTMSLVDARILQWLPKYCAQVASDEEDTKYQIQPTPDKTGIQISSPITLQTELGISALELLNVLEQIHTKNIEGGHAFPKSKAGPATGKVTKPEILIK